MAKKKVEEKEEKAVERKKPGPKKGSVSNNPDGRTKGAKNKVSATVKYRIAQYVEDDFDAFIKEVKKLPVKDRVKAKIELIKLVVPRPLADEEKEAFNTQSVLFKRLSQPCD